MYLSQTTMLYTLNLCSDVCQLCLNKTRKGEHSFRDKVKAFLCYPRSTMYIFLWFYSRKSILQDTMKTDVLFLYSISFYNCLSTTILSLPFPLFVALHGLDILDSSPQTATDMTVHKLFRVSGFLISKWR